MKKGLYKDGHEREDVLEYRNQLFLPKFQELQPRMLEWDSEGKLIHTVDEIWAMTGECPLVVVTHDECIFHANDGLTHVWTLKDSMLLRKKGHGQGIMLSEFITSSSQLTVPLSITDTQLASMGLRRNAIESMEFGNDTWWTGEKLKDQVLNCAIPIFNLQFPGCQALFLFDNARNHDSYAFDALRANLMNLEAGGKAPLMRLGWFRDKDNPLKI